MKLRISFSALALCLLCVTPFFVRSVSSSSKPKDPFLGIAPEDDKYYKSSDVIKCKDGSKKFTKVQLNDDFCDCPDGTDEPGTSACPGGKFYCQNAGHIPIFIFSSRVNDGICDCCDGSDEYDGKVKCPNTCWEAGKVARDKLKRKIATYQEGVTLRKQEVEKAKLALAKDEAELLKLKEEESILKRIVKQLKERKEQIEKAEEKEQLQKEKEEKEKKEAEKKANSGTFKADEEDMGHGNEAGKQSIGEDNAVATNHDNIGLMDDSSRDQDAAEEDKLADILNDASANIAESERSLHKEAEENAVVDKGELSVEHEINFKDEKEESSDEVIKKGDYAYENTQGLSKEELGRLVASRWTRENPDNPSKVADTAQDGNDDHEDRSKETDHEEYEGYASEADDDNHRYDDEDIDDEIYGDDRQEEHDDHSSSYNSYSETEPDLSDDTATENPSWLEKIQRTVRNIFQAVHLFQTPVNQSDVAYIRKEYDQSSVKLSKMQSRISSLMQKLKHDFGPEKEFYSFYDRCFEGKENKYTYKVCPYKQASQEEGYSTTRLGQWDKFEDSYKVMIFSNGDKCWNGPDRSLKVKLKCGLKNEITDVDEPSRCEYVAVLSTPALCQEEKLKELQQKLEAMSKEQPQAHDEL
ncbi:hypothetical protein L6164_015151 [Bauhinia variegata]|uniref:Uncharacterized protein n=1 Tax=Bauhinia variegata TaxID=167791 RepID=A0ACB9NJV0_BAUVA|nr:hypothetical protein L6164_015151 [Bauhinia variegata]